MSAAQEPGTRPRIVGVAFGLLVAGAVALMGGGLLSATVGFDAARGAIDRAVSDDQVRSYLEIYRGLGIGAVLAGGGLAFVAGRTRNGDPRYRRATVALGVAITFVIAGLAFFAGVAQPIILLAIVPIVIGTVLLTRPAATAWFTAQDAA